MHLPDHNTWHLPANHKNPGENWTFYYCSGSLGGIEKTESTEASGKVSQLSISDKSGTVPSIVARGGGVILWPNSAGPVGSLSWHDVLGE